MDDATPEHFKFFGGLGWLVNWRYKRNADNHARPELAVSFPRRAGNRAGNTDKEIQVTVNGVTLSHKFFSHIEQHEKVKILAEILKKQSHVVSFKENGIEKFACVVEKTNKGIHMRETGGNFIWNVSDMEFYCREIAKRLGLKWLTLRTKIPAVAEAVKRHGYKLFYTHDDGSLEFEKAV